MSSAQEVIVHGHHVDVPAGVKAFIEERCEAVCAEFPEVSKVEVTMEPEGDGFTAHAHATGRKTNVAATHDWGREMGQAAEQVLDKIATRLRRRHDKQRTMGRKETIG